MISLETNPPHGQDEQVYDGKGETLRMRKHSPKNHVMGKKWKKPHKEQQKWDPFLRKVRHAVDVVYVE